MPAALPVYMPWLMTAGFGWLYYRRIRRHFGWQPWRPVRNGIRIGILLLVSAMLVLAAVYIPHVAWGVAAGAVAGGVVGQQVQSMMNRSSGVDLEVRRDNGTTFLVVQAQGVTQFQPGQRVTIATHGNTVTITPR